MTNEEKQLLLKDLAQRLPYGIKVNIPLVDGDKRIYTVSFNDMKDFTEGNINIKPYLRPMSSMTKEEKGEFDEFVCIDEEAWNGDSIQGFINQAIIMSDGIDWLNAHYFDYRGLIPMGLALEAPEDMYKMIKYGTNGNK